MSPKDTLIILAGVAYIGSLKPSTRLWASMILLIIHSFEYLP
jgi:hypothetical protein